MLTRRCKSASLKGKRIKKNSSFIFVLLPRRSPTLPLQVGPRVGFYHLAAGLSYATLPLKGAKVFSLPVPVGQDCPHPLRDGSFDNNSF